MTRKLFEITQSSACQRWTGGGGRLSRTSRTIPYTVGNQATERIPYWVGHPSIIHRLCFPLVGEKNPWRMTRTRGVPSWGEPLEEKSCQLIYVAAEARDQTGGEVSIQSQDITDPPRVLDLTQEKGTGKW